MDDASFLEAILAAPEDEDLRIVYTVGVLGALGGGALGAAVLRPTPTPGPAECGMWVLPGMFLGGAVGAALTIWGGLRLTRSVGVLRRAE